MKKFIVVYFFLFFSTVLFFCPFPSKSAVVQFKDGTTITGEIVSETSKSVTIDKPVNGGKVTVTYDKENIVKIKKEVESENARTEKELQEFKSLIHSKLNKIDRFNATVVTVTPVKSGKLKQESEIWYKKGKGFKFRGIADIREGRGEEMETVLTKNYMKTLGPEGIIERINLSRIREELKNLKFNLKYRQNFDMWNSFNLLKPFNYLPVCEFKVVDWKVENLAGKPYYNVSLVKEEKTDKGIEKINASLWLDKNYGLLRKLVKNTGEGNQIYFMELENVSINSDNVKGKIKISPPQKFLTVNRTFIFMNEIEELKVDKFLQSVRGEERIEDYISPQLFFVGLPLPNIGLF